VNPIKYNFKNENPTVKLKKKIHKSGDVEVHKGWLYNYRHRIGIMWKTGKPTTVLFNETLWKRTVLPTFAMENDNQRFHLNLTMIFSSILFSCYSLNKKKTFIQYIFMNMILKKIISFELNYFSFLSMRIMYNHIIFNGVAAV